MMRYDRRRAARYLTSLGRKTSSATLATLATRGGGPSFYRAGRSVFYLQSDLDDFLRAQVIGPFVSTSTSPGLHPPPGDHEQDLEDEPWKIGDREFDEITRWLDQEWHHPIKAEKV